MKLQKPRELKIFSHKKSLPSGNMSKNLLVRHLGNTIMLRFAPIFEHYEVISRSVGDTTDIVTKEMYDFYDEATATSPNGRTAPVVRSYVENKLFAPEVQKPVKLYYGLYVPLRAITSWSSAGVSPDWSRVFWF